MTDTLVRYHSDGFRPRRPAINVKCHGFDLAAYDRLEASVGDADAQSYYETAWSDLAEAFWDEAEEQAASLGLGPIETEGRQGGWLVLTDGRDPEDMHCVNHRYGENDRCAACVAMQRSWLRRYRMLTDWCNAYIAAVPAEQARIAAEIATDLAVAP